MITIPTIGWVAKLGPGRGKLASFSIAKYGAQTGSDWQWMPDAGNGIRSSGQNVTGNDPNDANVPSSVAFQQAWVQHLVGRWGTSAAGGVRYYVLDNEPSIWHATHRDVHPTGATMDEILTTSVDVAAAIKNVDAGALVVGPEEWGWSGYFYSGYDQQYGSQNGWGTLPDRVSHGGADYLPWFLDTMRQRSATAGRRLLDVFTVHYYPQGGEFGDDVSAAMQLRRNRSTRSLWDPNYVDETWINDRVRLIPRLRGWVDQYYAGTRIGITEYNWGAENHINGATTQADILGIFGREGLDMAARWATPAAATPTYKAIKLYRNYDGRRSTFGDTSVAAATATPDVVSAFAAERSSDGAITGDARQQEHGGRPDHRLARQRGARGQQRGVAADVGERHHPARRRGGLRRARPDGDAAGAERHAVRDPARHRARRPAGGAHRRPHRAVAVLHDTVAQRRHRPARLPTQRLRPPGWCGSAARDTLRRPHPRPSRVRRRSPGRCAFPRRDQRPRRSKE